MARKPSIECSGARYHQLGASAGSASDLEQTHGFTPGGRFETLNTSRANNTVSRTFTYGYLANSPLVATLAAGGTPFTVTRTYETARDVLTAIDAKWSTTSVTRYDYTANALYQRATAKQSGSAFADYGDATYHRYTYNPRGELTAAPGYLGADPALTTQPLPGRQHGFGYDSLGNRQWADRTGDPAQHEDYTTNALNQVTTKENLTVPVQGTVDAAAPATKTAVAGAASTSRQGRFFSAEAAVANATAPWAGALQVYAAKIGGGTAGADLIRTETRTAQLAQALQSFTYDLDGNLTSDGLWDYQWDADVARQRGDGQASRLARRGESSGCPAGSETRQNRLIRQATTSLAVGAGFPNRVLEFRYDHIGRRVQKRVLDGGSGAELTSRRYLYSGWDLLAEFAAPGGTTIGALLRSYTWGLDLVGSLSATGGVGALLQIRDEVQNKTLLPTYDGNGNVASLLNADTGALEAAYEYDPFGQLLRAEGAYAKENPFRFSTKFQDEETGLIYYGYRYYSSALGRFLNRDPIAEQGGLNLYAFAGNDGVNGVDYLGLDGDGIIQDADGGNGGIFFPRINFGMLSFVVRRGAGPAKPKPPQAAPPSSLDRERLEDREISPTDARTVFVGINAENDELSVVFRIPTMQRKKTLTDQIDHIFAALDRETERQRAQRELDRIEGIFIDAAIQGFAARKAIIEAELEIAVAEGIIITIATIGLGKEIGIAFSVNSARMAIAARSAFATAESAEILLKAAAIAAKFQGRANLRVTLSIAGSTLFVGLADAVRSKGNVTTADTITSSGGAVNSAIGPGRFVSGNSIGLAISLTPAALRAIREENIQMNVLAAIVFDAILSVDRTRHLIDARR